MTTPHGLTAEARLRIARGVLQQAERLREEVREDIRLQSWGRDDIQMNQYNALANMASATFSDDPVLGKQLVLMPDANLQWYRFDPMSLPNHLPSTRLETRLTFMIDRLSLVLQDSGHGRDDSGSQPDPLARQAQATEPAIHVIDGRAPRVFVSHSGEPPSFFRLIRFLGNIGTVPVVAEWLPFRGRQVPDHVRATMGDCQAAVIFATATDTEGGQQPGRGVLIETGMLQERFGDRVIYLLEDGASFGPMADGFAHESFTEDCLERAFERIVVELKAHGIIP